MVSFDRSSCVQNSWGATFARRSLFISSLLAFASGCATDDDSLLSQRELAAKPVTSPSTPSPSSCGYRVESGTYSTWGNGYEGWVKLTNVSGANGVAFDALVDVGSTTIKSSYDAVRTPVEHGYLFSEPKWLASQPIKAGKFHKFGFIGRGAFQGIKAYLNTLNDQACDAEAPVIDLAVSQDFFTSTGTLDLTAAVSDNVAVRKVTFYQDDAVIGVDWTAPYALQIPVAAALNGRHTFKATAADPSGNLASNSERVLVAIDNRFFGTAVDTAADYEDVVGLFTQLTPGNAGKWGSVEATRDVMNFAQLDQAYDFAQEHGLRFKLHTLFWGLQQPSWLAALPPAEQLEEIHEWLTALSERYGDVEMIDVVNEPINAPPGYSAALGGAGETGHDWLINAFELARDYFPNSELLLNEYNVLIMESSTANYLALVQLLQDRGLIDGIGLQGHFLERSEVATVEANLGTLAGTGLPIYISEFDLNLADDAYHANRTRDLLSVFWANPSVVGVTHWGHLQGSMWQENAYLIRQDGSYRPGLDWILCTQAGEPDCTVPEYVPPTRVGDDYGITLEAEEYDSADGLLSSGDTVAYTDDGDWLAYADVQFEAEWDTLEVTYAKGNTDTISSISVHLGSLESAPIATVALPPTAGWGSLETVTVPWPATSGNHAVYVTFHGSYGVANVDSIRIGTEPPPAVNLVQNGTFESGDTSGWYGWGGSSLSATTAQAHSGSYSMLRAGGGTAATNLTTQVEAGVTYQMSFWVRIEGAATSNVNITQALNCGSGDQYSWVANNGSVPADTWVELAGTVAIPETCNLTSLQLYAEGPGAGVNLYIDDVTLYGPPEGAQNLITNGTFEIGNTSGWYGWGGSVLSATTTQFHGGAFSMLRAGGGTAATDVTSVVQAGESYAMSFWVRIEGAATSNVNVTRALNCGGNTSYGWVANNGSIPADTWVELAGNLAIPADCDLVQLQLYAEGPDSSVNLYIDDVSLITLP